MSLRVLPLVYELWAEVPIGLLLDLLVGGLRPLDEQPETVRPSFCLPNPASSIPAVGPVVVVDGDIDATDAIGEVLREPCDAFGRQLDVAIHGVVVRAHPHGVDPSACVFVVELGTAEVDQITGLDRHSHLPYYRYITPSSPVGTP